MPEPIATTGTIFAALATLVGAVFGRARVDAKGPDRILDRSLEPQLELVGVPKADDLTFSDLKMPDDWIDAPEPIGVPKSSASSVRRRPPLRAPHAGKDLTVVSAEKGADTFVAFLNREGRTGYFAVHEIDDLWSLCCELHDIEPIHGRFIREVLENRGLKLGQVRLNTPQFAAIRARTGKERLVVYRIPTSRRLGMPLPDKGGYAPPKGGDRPDSTVHTPGAHRLAPGYRENTPDFNQIGAAA